MTASIPSLDLPPFRERFPWWGGDLQTLASRMRPPRRLEGAHRSQRLSIRLGDGDTLQAVLDQPRSVRPGLPLAILIHGLTGSEESSYILSQAHCLLEGGWRVLRLNLRGAGPSRATCGGQYYAGRSQDLRELLALLPAKVTHEGIVAIGYSLGGAMLLKYLGEEGTASRLKAAAAVSAPIDLSLTCRNMRRARNILYHRFLLREMKREATGKGAVLSAAEREEILRSPSIWHYDEAFIAPRHGFAGAEDYYERCKPLAFMPRIRVPTLILAALDDPWIPGALYGGFDWAANRSLLPLLTRHGGHVGFHGTDGDPPWSDRAVRQFLESA